MKTKPTITNIALVTGVALFAAVPAWAQDVLPFPAPPMGGKVGPTMQESEHKWRKAPSHLPEDAPNILIISDNGASAEGLEGSVAELNSQNGIPSTVAEHIAIAEQLGGLDVIGSPKVDNHVNAAWSWAGDSPFRYTKLIAADWGGTRTPMVISWPKRIKPDEERARAWGHGGFVLTIPSVEVPDLRVYQGYLPEKWGVAIMGGQVSLSGAAAYSERAVTGKLSLMSSNTDLAVRECRFTPDLELELKDAGEVSAPASVDILGTQLRLNQARLASTQKGESEPRSLSLTIDRGVLGGTPPARALRVSAFLCGDLPDHHLDCPQSA